MLVINEMGSACRLIIIMIIMTNGVRDKAHDINRHVKWGC